MEQAIAGVAEICNKLCSTAQLLTLCSAYEGRSNPTQKPCLLLTCRCLRISKVLYGTITQASKLGLDVLNTLQSCAATPTPFLTQWATQQDTTCPNIPIDARLGDLLADYEDAVVVPSSMSRPRLAWANILQFGEVMGELSDLRSVSDKLFGSKSLQLTYLVMICMPVVFFLLHHGALMPLSAKYQQLSQADRLICCQHTVYAVVFGLSFVPQAVLAFRALFMAWNGTYLVSSELAVLVGVFIGTRAVLYVGEAAVRSVVKWSWLLVVHHLLFFTIVVMAVWSQDAAIVGIGFVLDLFACAEAPLYVGLIGYRLEWPARSTRGILRGACAWYIVTRVFQTVLLVYLIVGFAGMPAVRYTYEFIITAILCRAFTVIQAYTLVIYRAMDVKLGMKLEGGSILSSAAAQGCQSLATTSSASSMSCDSCGDVAISVMPIGMAVSDAAAAGKNVGTVRATAA